MPGGPTASLRSALQWVPYVLRCAAQDALELVEVAPNNPVHAWLLAQHEFQAMQRQYAADTAAGVRFN
jgi:hypothetical protein